MTLTTEQQRVFEWLNDKLRLPVFAETYKGALRMLDERSPGYVTFVSHAGRDFMNLLARAVTGREGRRVDYQGHLDKLQNEWKEEWGAEGLNRRDDAENGHLIPHTICQKVKELIDDHKAGRLRNADADALFFSTFLAYEDREKIPQNFLREWKAARTWFLKYAHLRPNDFVADAPFQVEKHFGALDGLLHVAASSEYERMKELNAILEETNG